MVEETRLIQSLRRLPCKGVNLRKVLSKVLNTYKGQYKKARFNMLNPFGSQQDPGLYSYVNLKKRMLQNVQATSVNDQIFQVVQNSFEAALRQENIVLSNPERKRLLSQILKSVLEDMLQKLDNSTKM